MHHIKTVSLKKQEHIDQWDAAFVDLSLKPLFYVSKGFEREESRCQRCKLDRRSGKPADTGAAGLMNG